MRSGIYQIENQMNGKCYVGSTVSFQKRWKKHLRALRHGYHVNPHLQAAFGKYGEQAFVFSILEHVQPQILIEREQYYLDRTEPEYNIALMAASPMSGRRHTAETKRKMSDAHKGKLGNNRRGIHHSEETKRKIGEAQKGNRGNNYGKHPSAETRARMSKAQKGKVFREESRAKLSATWTPVRRQRLADRLKGKHLSRETKRKIGLAHKGRHLSAEHRRKLSEAQKAHWRRIHEAELA